MMPGIQVGGVVIDFMARRRNRFNGVVKSVRENGHFIIQITKAGGALQSLRRH